MLLWASLLVLEAASKPVISLHPPWTVVFIGETVTLTCNVSHFLEPEKRRRFFWFLGRRKLGETPGSTLPARDSGAYGCQTQDSLPSDYVRLTFSSGLLILQAPHAVFEGDTLVLRCRVKRRETLTTVKYSWNEKVISTSSQSQDLLIPHASANNSGSYRCTGYLGKNNIFRSNSKIVRIQELFPQPRLKVTPSQPTEGGSMNLSCETQRAPERRDTVLHFIFFREHGGMLSDWSRSPELQITDIRRQDSGWYRCGVAAAQDIQKHSLPLQVSVQGVPVSGVLLETQPPEGLALAGKPLVLVCSAAAGTGDTTFSWHREDTGQSLGRERRRSRTARLEIPAVGGSHAGAYFCTADNGHGLARSAVLNVTVTGTPRDRSGLTASGAAGGLLSILLLAAGLLIYHRHQRKSGDGSPGDTARSPPTTGPGEAPHGRCQGQKDSPVELQYLHGNESVREGDLVYSEIQVIQLGHEGEGGKGRSTVSWLGSEEGPYRSTELAEGLAKRCQGPWSVSRGQVCCSCLLLGEDTGPRGLRQRGQVSGRRCHGWLRECPTCMTCPRSEAPAQGRPQGPGSDQLVLTACMPSHPGLLIHLL
ncbi:Fc receptor-like protein 4 isoform X2 [Suricata suricatta]|uniref:Fc receptor-like protein 4 isoform X2 n=1 Tax=Suricata suricatta TaxID=37032 RepID=UPI00115531C8|nr:Fc receptor-like protein 4 isoform X2 [Suricata suricatta]